MTTPWLHPKTKVYYFRKGVPLRMQPLLGGKKLVQISLGTKDPHEARAAHILMAAEVAKDWAALLEAPRDLPVVPVKMDKKALVTMAGEMYDAEIKKHENGEGPSDQWRKKLMRLQRALPPEERDTDQPLPFTTGWAFSPGRNAILIIGDEIRAFLLSRGIKLTWDCHVLFAQYAASALAQAYRVLERRAKGDFRPDPDRERFPKPVPGTTWQALFEVYCVERKPKASSLKRMRGVLTAFFEFLGHDRPGLVTDDDAIRWKQKRLKEVAIQTVRDADIAHPRALFRFAKANKYLPTNPFADVTVVIKGDKRYDRAGNVKNTRELEYRPEEAEQILRASLVPCGPRMTEEGAAARRWIPWLCAYTGARVNELTQTRAEDIKQMRSRNKKKLIWMIHITPEAGRVKDDDERDVAIHPHLIEQGFLDYVKSREGKCLFYEPSRSRGGTPAHPQYAKVGERIAAWIRSDKVGITDQRISPNHAWRHLVRSQLLDAGIQEQVINGIDGHQAKSVGQKYGRIWPEVSLRAISRIPPYEVD
ncbi:DUF6538 domain-containing protein [Devosia sediminis]|uniref:DUF6538 domain-containing protein n=1 Tax=Devosia sediminis TaxID=2798801 RepID=A0A934J284_9HYPH|nr:DUF6538 domain-containing protein [Devosia sediminis]MBJ3786410.1 hypothetical protein [Devosia sediminis]